MDNLILKDKKGNEIDKSNYDVEGGDIFYKENKVGTFEQGTPTTETSTLSH